MVEYLANYDYFPSATDPCLFRHTSNGFAFTLVVDDFLIKYKDRASAMHLFTALQERYPLKFDWSTCQYLGIDIAFEKRKRTVKLSIPGHIPKMLRPFDPDGVGLATTPCIYVPPIKGIKAFQMVKESTSPALDEKGKTRIQEVLAIPNPLPLFCAIINVLLVLPLILLRRKDPRLSICVGIGFVLGYWREGASNLADFYTKALAHESHHAVMPYIVTSPP